MSDFCTGRQPDGTDLKFDVVYDCASASGGGEDYYKTSLKLLKKGAGKTEGEGMSCKRHVTFPYFI